MSSWVVEAENLHKTFAWAPVLRDVSCTIAAGEAVVIFGPNGAGKTTFLRVLATLLKPSSGTLKLFERPAHETAVRKRLGFLGHESFLYPDLTPIENLTFYAKAYQLKNPSPRIEAVLAQVGLQDWAKTPLRTFSRGMEQRLALARVLLHEPDLLLLDEPHTGLDQPAVELLQTILMQAKDAGKTIVFTTHDFALGLALCSRAMILTQGRIVWHSADDTPSADEFSNIYTAITQPSALSLQH
jgi:heme exporter protein A